MADFNPCQSCGACCAHFRVSFYWAEAESLGLPEALTEAINPWMSCMKGTGQRAGVRCVALAGEIGRKPANLHLHVQRISLWSNLEDTAATVAAIVDLWIVLGRYGAELRMRMLREHYDALEEHDLGLYLSARIEDGLDRHDPRLALPGVVLARPVEGNRIFLQDSATLSGVTS